MLGIHKRICYQEERETKALNMSTSLLCCSLLNKQLGLNDD